MSMQARTRMTIAMTLLLAMAIAIGTLTPPDQAPQAPSGVDKLLHFGAFAALIFPAALLRPDFLRWLLPVGMIYGGMIDIIQPSVGRHAEWGDFFANTLGAFAGAGVGYWLHSRLLNARDRRARRTPPPEH